MNDYILVQIAYIKLNFELVSLQKDKVLSGKLRDYTFQGKLVSFLLHFYHNIISVCLTILRGPEIRVLPL